MKRKTIYTACLYDGKNFKIIKAKTRAKLRKFAPFIRKIWMDSELPNKQKCLRGVQWSDRFMLDKFLKIPTKGRYRMEIWKEPLYFIDPNASSRLVFKAKFLAVKKFARIRKTK